MKPTIKIRIGFFAAVAWIAYSVYLLISIMILAKRGYINPFDLGDTELLATYIFVLLTILPLVFYAFAMVRRSLRMTLIAYCVWGTPFVVIAILRCTLPLFIEGYRWDFTNDTIIAIFFLILLLLLLGLGVRGLAEAVKVKNSKLREEE